MIRFLRPVVRSFGLVTLNTLVAASSGIVVTACGNDDDGGPCTYTKYPGTCRGTGGGEFTFAGMVEGMAVTFAGNSGSDLALDEEVACTLSYVDTGTCTPCELDIGACGQEAFAGQP